MDTPDIKRTVRAVNPEVKIKNKNIDLSPYVKAIETYKSLKNPAGAFAIELSPVNKKDNITSYNIGEELYKSIDSMDIVEIGITKPGLMVGLVDSIDKTKAIHTENYSRSIIIKGRDFAKLLIEDSVIYSPQLADNKHAAQTIGAERLAFVGSLLSFRNKQMFNSPVAAVLYILRNIPAVHIEAPFTDVAVYSTDNSRNESGKLGAYFICDLKAFLGDKVAKFGFSQFNAKVWNVLMLCIDEFSYELFTDTVLIDTLSGKEVRPCLFLRPKPYDRTTDNIIRVKDVQKNIPDEGVIDKINNAANSFPGMNSYTGKISEGTSKAIAAGEKVIGNVIDFNKVIYPSFDRKEITLTTNGGTDSGDGTGNNSKQGGSSSTITTNVSITGMDENGIINDPVPVQFKGERDINNPGDANNKSMVIPWTWDGKDSFFRTMVTNQPYHTIYDRDIIEESMGVNDSEVIDYYTLSARNDLSSDIAANGTTAFPLMDGYKIKKFGIRSMHAESNLLKNSFKLRPSEVENYRISNPSKKDIFTASEHVNNRERLFNWYRYNDILESGVIVIRGNQDIRIGDKIFMPDAISKGGNKGIYAYVQGVKNRLEYTQSGIKYQTTLELVRGENPKDIEAYRSMVNTGTSGSLKLGATYRNYDNALGNKYEGDPLSPQAHNIIKYDIIQSIDELDPDKKTNQTPENLPVYENDYTTTPGDQFSGTKFSAFISRNVKQSQQNILSMSGTQKPFADFSPEIINQIDEGAGDGVEIDGRIFRFLEALGSAGFPFQIELLSLVSGHKKYIGGVEPEWMKDPHALGKACDISVSGDKVKNITGLMAYVLNRKIGDIKPDSRFNFLLTKSGAFPGIIITCPNQDIASDSLLWHNVAEITDEIMQDHIDKIQLIY